MTAVNVVPAVSVLAIYRQAEARNELQNPFYNDDRTRIVCFRTAKICFAGDRQYRHVHCDTPHHVQQSHQEKYSPNNDKPRRINIKFCKIKIILNIAYNNIQKFENLMVSF